MTTAELIAQLRDLDPDGTTPVVVDNAEVYTVENIEACWDGRAQFHVYDDAKRGKEWCIKGMRVTSNGRKVRLSTIDVEMFIACCPDGPIEIDLPEYQKPEWEKRIADWREETKRIIAEVKAANAARAKA